MATPANEIILFGSGVITHPDGQVDPAPAALQRIERTVAYYDANRDAFRSRDAQIISTGGYGQLSTGMEAPKNPNAREAIVAADHLVRAGIPHRLIRVEPNSTSTLENLTESIRLSYIDPANYDYSRRLGGVSHSHHLRRIILSTRRLGIADQAFVPIPTAEQDDARREATLRALYRVAYAGASGAYELLAREHRIAQALTAVRSLRKS